MTPLDLIPWALAAAGAAIILGVGAGIGGAIFRACWRSVEGSKK